MSHYRDFIQFYSLLAQTEKRFLKYRRYLTKEHYLYIGVGMVFKPDLDYRDPVAETEKTPGFIRWIDHDWQSHDI